MSDPAAEHRWWPRRFRRPLARDGPADPRVVRGRLPVPTARDRTADAITAYTTELKRRQLS